MNRICLQFSLLLLLGICGLSGLVSEAQATKYWVATTGSDANSCVSISGAADPGTYKLTPKAAVACLTSGDTLHMKAGTYGGAGSIIHENTVVVPSGTVGNPTIIEGEGPAGCGIAHNCTTIIQAPVGGGWNFDTTSYVTLRLFELDGTLDTTTTDQGVRVAGTASNFTFEDMYIHDFQFVGIAGTNDVSFITLRRTDTSHNARDPAHAGPGHGAYLNGTDVLIEYSVSNNNGQGISGANSNGWQLYTGTAGRAAHRAIVRYSVAQGNVQAGLVTDGDNVQIYNNIFSGNNIGWDHGYGCPVGATYYNNTVYNNTTKGLEIGISGTCGVAVTASNNHIVGNGTNISLLNSATNGGVTNRTTGTITDCTVSTSDFTQIASSLCIDAGTIIAGRSYDGSAPDIGAFEMPVFASCVVQNATPSLLSVTFTNNLNPPLLPATGITGFTARKAGSNDIITSAVRTGSNQVDLTLTNAIINGNAVDISFTPGNLTDSALIGGTLNQAYKTVLTNQSCTNNVGGGAASVLTQTVFRFNGLRGTQAAPVATPYASAPENTNIYIRPGGSVRLRMGLSCTTAACPASAFYLYYSKNGGAYTAVPDTYDSGNIGFCGTGPDPDIPASGTATTQQLSGSGTFAAGGLIRTSNSIPSIDIVLNGRTENEWCLSFNASAVATDFYDFRYRKQDGSVIDTYSVTPRATIMSTQSGMGF